MTATNNTNTGAYMEPVNVNMKYGAPDLKKKYNKYVGIGLIIALIIHVTLITAYGISILIEQKAKEREQFSRIVEFKELDTPPSANEEENLNQMDVQVPQDQIASIRDLGALIPEPVAREKADTTTIKALKDLENLDESKQVGKENKEGRDLELGERIPEKIEQKVQEDTKIEKKTVEKTKVYQTFEVEQAPVAVNLGEVRASMRYPEIARSSNIEGKVTVKVLVSASGSVESVGGISGPEVFYNEVRDKVMNLQFTPAKQNGVPVKCWVSVPFSFTLKKQQFKKDEDKEKE
ncbi:MAG: TonB family protein [Ignavibacteria bacterium]|nr:TonB family protein [Ignavibacteria bacterium]